MYPETWCVDQSSYERWASHRDERLAAEPAIKDGPLVSIVMPVYNTAPHFLSSAIESVRAQKYQNWQLCIADDASTDPSVATALQRFAAQDPRIRVAYLANNAGIACASDKAAELAEGAYVALMDHDDRLHPEALNVVVGALKNSPGAKFLYTDSDHLNGDGRRCNPFFKPDWDYSRFLGQNYLNHLTVIRRDLLQACDGWRAGYQGSQDYEIYLRFIETIRSSEILHVPEVLYHWRDVPDSVARSNLGKAVQAARQAIRHHFERKGIRAEVKGCAHAIIYNRIEWPLANGSVHLVLYGDSDSDLELARLALATADEHLPVQISLVKAVGAESELIAAFNDIVASTKSDFVCLMNARLRPVKADWMQRLASIVNRADVGIATGKILASDGRLACGPYYHVRSKGEDRKPVWLEREDSKGYIASLCLDHEVAAVPSDLLIAKTGLLRQCELVTNSDSLDTAVRSMCQSVARVGQSTVWSPSVLFQYCAGDEPPPRVQEISEDYEVSIPERLAPNPNCAELEWEIVWKAGGD